jgi:hypothetical protein
MTKDEALKLALEALEGKYLITASMLNQQFQAITAVKEALAQPAQEPVAYIYEFWADRGHKGLSFTLENSADNTPLYTTPLAAQPAQEPKK